MTCFTITRGNTDAPVAGTQRAASAPKLFETRSIAAHGEARQAGEYSRETT